MSLHSVEKKLAGELRYALSGMQDITGLAASTGLIRFVFADILCWLGGSVAIFFVEIHNDPHRFSSFWDVLYFTWISMATVGYGDYTAASMLGRIVVMALVFVHIILMALLSAGIASMLVSRRLKEGKGLEKIRFENHLIICGWNGNGQRIIQHIDRSQEQVPIVLVNSLTEDEITTIISSHPKMEIRWVVGDYTQEALYERANAKRARGAIILADYTLHDADKSDERAILATLALKEIKSDLLVSAEILNESSRSHLKRARADEVIVAGENDPFFLTASTLSPGLSRIVRSALMPDADADFTLRDIPKGIIGRTFGDLLKHFYEEHGEIVLGIITYEPGISLDQVLSDDYSIIDQFIEEKFKQAKLGGGRSSGFHPRLNPLPSYIIVERDKAVVLSRAKEHD